jgi:hypothetical protein
MKKPTREVPNCPLPTDPANPTGRRFLRTTAPRPLLLFCSLARPVRAAKNTPYGPPCTAFILTPSAAQA